MSLVKLVIYSALGGIPQWLTSANHNSKSEKTTANSSKHDDINQKTCQSLSNRRAGLIESVGFRYNCLVFVIRFNILHFESGCFKGVISTYVQKSIVAPKAKEAAYHHFLLAIHGR